MSPCELVLEALCPKGLSSERTIDRPPFVLEPKAWNAALEFAGRLHASVPFLATVTKASWGNELPPSTRDSFEGALGRGRMVLGLLDHELQLALSVLQREEIPVMLLKGAELGRRFYPERLLRPMTDVDLLVPEADFARAVALFESRNYHSVGVGYPGRFRTELSREGSYPVVELHSRIIAGDDEASVRGYWAKSQRVKLEDLATEVRVLCPTDGLIYLIRHGAVQHVLESPLWLCDIHFLIEAQQEALDWDAFLLGCRKAHFNTAAWFVLSYLSERWETPVPPHVVRALAARVSPWRRALLRFLGEPARLFPQGRRSRPWLMAARYCFRDDALHAARYFFERFRRLHRVSGAVQ